MDNNKWTITIGQCRMAKTIQNGKDNAEWQMDEKILMDINDNGKAKRQWR